MSSNDFILIKQLTEHEFIIQHEDADTCGQLGSSKRTKTLEDAVRVANMMKDEIRKEILGGVEYGIEIILLDKEKK